ncbi:glycosyl transferase [Planctomycetota bacterium]|jgi:dolichol-phosphate mannosyltransferase|nr:glycosyltransferase family 2 protein [Planctomycetota bacterium]GDY03768.1 glycosyl transferase [Planctomycetota bacterium]
MTTTETPRFSLVVPIYNEQENVHNLLDEVAAVLLPLAPFEALLVDDGSKDGSRERMVEWKQRHNADWLRVICLQKNSGQSSAVMAGVEHARGRLVATMDGDMQNDPRDIEAMLRQVESGAADAVVGVRRNRKDTFVRRVSSRVGNGVRNFVTGDRVTDAACGIKVIRRDLWLRVPRFAGMHRFMATLIRCLGGKVVEMDVNHRPRAAGTAKYGIGNRALRGLRDCFSVNWLKARVLLHEVREEL